MTTQIQLDIATRADTSRIAELAAAARGRKTASKSDISAIDTSVVAGDHLWVVARDGEEIVGYVAAMPLSTIVYELENVHVVEEHRGHGIGAALLAELFAILQRSGVTAVVIAHTPDVRTWMGRAGVQSLDEGLALGIAARDGGIHAVRPRGAERRTQMGVGFLHQITPGAIAWAVPVDGVPTRSDIAQSFYDTFRGRSDEAISVLGAAQLVSAMADLGRFDLVSKWISS